MIFTFFNSYSFLGLRRSWTGPAQYQYAGFFLNFFPFLLLHWLWHFWTFTGQFDRVELLQLICSICMCGFWFFLFRSSASLNLTFFNHFSFCGGGEAHRIHELSWYEAFSIFRPILIYWIWHFTTPPGQLEGVELRHFMRNICMGIFSYFILFFFIFHIFPP